MAYEKTTWISGETPLSATNMNHIEEGIEVNSNYIAQLSNPNFLINGDFKINQRGQSSYTNKASVITYCVDRFRLWGDKASLTVTVNDDGTITFANSDSSMKGYLTQEFENYLEANNYTLSCEVVNITGNVEMHFEGSSQQKTLYKGINSYTLNCKPKGVSFGIQGVGSVTLKWVKLEQGSIATPFSPRPYAEEMTLCKIFYRYFRTTGIIEYEYGNSGAYSYLVSFTFEEMRANPTLNKFVCGFNNSSGIYTETQGLASIVSTHPTRANIRSKAFTNRPNNYGYGVDVQVELDAEIY